MHDQLKVELNSVLSFANGSRILLIPLKTNVYMILEIAFINLIRVSCSFFDEELY